MPNYHEVKVLEEEFWELGEIVSEGKPYMPPHAETMEGWAKHFEPDVRSNRERMRVHIVWGIISVALFMACMVIATALEESTRYFDGAIGAWCIIFIIAFSIFLWRRAAKSSKKRALELAVHSQTSEYRKVLEKMYASVTAQISLYDASVKRMQEIIAEANELID